MQTSSDDRIGPTLPRTKCPISALRFRERIDRFPPIFATSFLRQHVRFWEAARHRRTADLGAIQTSDGLPANFGKPRIADTVLRAIRRNF